MTLDEAIDCYAGKDPRGEYVLVLAGKDRKLMQKEEQDVWKAQTIEEHMAYYIRQGIPEKEAMKQVAKDRGCARRDIYNYLHSKR